ncbi:MAG: cytochrome b N-terminal domain-containing protein [Spirochaetota bacterium]
MENKKKLDAIGMFFTNLRDFPKTFRQSFIRHDKATSDRARSQRILSNLFLHIHSTKVHRFSLKPTFTLGLGVCAVSSFLILLITGVMLMVYYKPSISLAYDSVKDIQFVVPSGRFIRNLHRWATYIMLVSVFAHMARVFYTASYKRGRSFNWLIGLVLLVLTLILSFTGYLLPWDQLAYWATTIGSNIAGSFRELTDALGITHVLDIGGFMKVLVLGSEEIGQEALTRFYWLHVMVLPAVFVLFLSIHMWRIRKDGGLSRPDNIREDELKGIPKGDLSESVFSGAPPEKTYGLMGLVKGTSPAVGRGPEQTLSSWPTLFIAELAVFVATLAVVCILAFFLDAPLKEMANPAVPENPAKAPWYFLGLQELVSYSAFMGGVVIPGVVLLGLGLIPYLDREEQEIGRWFDNKAGKHVAFISFFFSLIVVIGMLVLTVNLGWLRNWFPQIPQIVITFVNPGTILVITFMFWSFRCMEKYKSIRIAAISLFTCFLVAYVILTYFATYHRGPNWDFYWLKSQWPGH